LSILKPVPPTTVEGQRGRLLLAVFIGMVGIFLANGVVPGAIEKFEDPISQKRAYLATVSVLLVASVLAAVVARRHSAVLAGLVGTALFLGSFNLTRPHDLTEAQPSLALASGLLFAVCLPGSRRVQTARLAGIAIAYFYLTLAVRHGWGSSVARDWISLGLAGAASVVPAMFPVSDRTSLEPNSVSTTNSSRGRTSATQ
jgi:hypothetical protein